MDRHAAEVELLRACSRVRAGAAERERIESALAGRLDWGLVLRLASWHGLDPLLDRHLAGIPGESVPRAARVEVWDRAARIRLRNEAFARELASLDLAFEAAGVRSLHYKGPTLAIAAYGDLGLREFGDLDILVDRGQLAAAQAILLARGYAPVYDLPPRVAAALPGSHAQYHVALRSASGLMVELHWKTDPEFPVESTGSDAWWAATARVPVEGRPVRCLVPEELTLALCVHGARHHWTCIGWVADVAERLRSASCGDWTVIGARARELGCARRVGVALRVARDLLEAPVPAEARDLVEMPGVASLARGFTRNLLDSRPLEPGSWQALGLNLALHERAGRRVRLVVDAVFLPTMAEWTRWRLPPALSFLYPVLRLGRLAAKYSGRAWGRLLRRGKLQT